MQHSGSGNIVPSGEGMVDFPAIFNILSRMGYSNRIGLALEPLCGFRIGTLKAFENALNSPIDYLEEIQCLALSCQR